MLVQEGQKRVKEREKAGWVLLVLVPVWVVEKRKKRGEKKRKRKGKGNHLQMYRGPNRPDCLLALCQLMLH